MTGKKQPRPRALRYRDRTTHEVALTADQRKWLERQQQGGRFSLNAIVGHCINIAMGKVEADSAQEEAISTSLTDLNNRVEKLERRSSLVLAFLNVDAQRQFGKVSPNTYEDHIKRVRLIAQQLDEAKHDSE